MVVVLLFPIILWASSYIYKRAGWKVSNYLGEGVPYNLGLCIFVAILGYSILIKNNFILIYLSTLWITGFIDDRFGTKYPKGLKGHLGLFIKSGKVTTGLFKLVSTVTVSFFFVLMIESSFIERITALLLLILSPHVMNLFDTRPLRVWKVISLHLVIFLPFTVGFSMSVLVSVCFIVALLIYYEGTRKGMLGDNGATLLGGVISVTAIYQLSFSLQVLIIGLYLLIIVITERFSISEFIETKPLLKRIDRWGVS